MQGLAWMFRKSDRQACFLSLDPLVSRRLDLLRRQRVRAPSADQTYMALYCIPSLSPSRPAQTSYLIGVHTGAPEDFFE